MDMESSGLTIRQLTEQVLKLAAEKSFGTKLEEISVLEKIALIHCEVSEACRAYRRKNFEGKDGFNEELADIVLRTLHLASVCGVDLEKEIIKKLEYNQTRVWDWENLNEKHT
jgi:NTP pyrophosphatase (non-canonical NTP hydrolase)